MKFSLLMLMLFTIACSQNPYKSNREQIMEFTSLAKEIVNDAKENVGPEVISKKTDQLLTMAKPILINFKKKNPICSELLDTVLIKEKEMKTLSLKQIEEQYHDGSALPQAADHCYNAKELVVHPATVSILTKLMITKIGNEKESREQIVDELEELVDHMHLL